jgi:hypothetical protein
MDEKGQKDTDTVNFLINPQNDEENHENDEENET